jgi:UDP-glucose 4-epimerase
VRDTAEGIVRALDRPESRGEVINLGGTETITILELARRIQVELEYPAEPVRANFIPYESLPGKYQDVRHRTPDTAKARELLGFEARVPLDEGLRDTVEWHQSLRRAGAAAEA